MGKLYLDMSLQKQKKTQELIVKKDERERDRIRDRSLWCPEKSTATFNSTAFCSLAPGSRKA